MEAAQVKSIIPLVREAGNAITPDTEEISKLISVLAKGNEKECEQAFFSLLKFCQLDVIPESKKQEVRSLFVRYLENIMPNEREKTPLLSDVGDTDQLLTHYLTKLLLTKVAPLSQLELESSTANFHQIKEIYFYLEKNVDDINAQLLDQVIEFFGENQLDMAQNICQILVDSNNASTSSEAQYLNECFTLSNWKEPEFLNYLNKAALTVGRPKTAYFLGMKYLTEVTDIKSNRNDVHLGKKNSSITALKFLLKAAAQGYVPAIDAVQKQAEESMCHETLLLLSIIYFDDSIPALCDDQVGLKLLKKGKQIRAEQQAMEITFLGRCEENKRFNIPMSDSIAERVQLAKNWIEQGRHSAVVTSEHQAFQGIVMLESFSLSLDNLFHPLLKETNNFLTNFLSISENRIWLIGHYAIEASKELYDNSGQEKYTNLFEKHISIILQDILKLFEQGNATAGKRLMHQLVDQEINFEWKNSSLGDKTFCSYFFDLLLDKNLPDDILHEVKLRRDRSINECSYSPEKLAEQQSKDESTQLKQRLNALLLSSKEKDAEDQFKLGLILHADKKGSLTAKQLFMLAASHGHEQARNFLEIHFTEKKVEKTAEKKTEKKPEEEKCLIQ